MAVEGGRKVKIYVDLNGNGGSGANWALVGQQRGGGVSRGTATADATHKDDDGWESHAITTNNWGISADGALKVGDTALAFLRTKWRAREKVYAKIDRTALSDISEVGLSSIEDMSEDFPVGDVISYQLQLKGDGALTVV